MENQHLLMGLSIDMVCDKGVQVAAFRGFHSGWPHFFGGEQPSQPLDIATIIPGQTLRATGLHHSACPAAIEAGLF